MDAKKLSERLSKIQESNYNGITNVLRDDIVAILREMISPQNASENLGEHAYTASSAIVRLDFHTYVVEPRGQIVEILVRDLRKQDLPEVEFLTPAQLDSVIAALMWARSKLDP